MKLRLLVTDVCNRSCDGCCNKQWDLSALPQIKLNKENLLRYSSIMLTGGEPLLQTASVINIIDTIKRHTPVPVYVYTAAVDRPGKIFKILEKADGITLTLHDKEDSDHFATLNNLMLFTNDCNGEFEGKSLRLNVFSGVDIRGQDMSLWQIKDNIEWIENCPLPEDEEFKRL